MSLDPIAVAQNLGVAGTALAIIAKIYLASMAHNEKREERISAVIEKLAVNVGENTAVIREFREMIRKNHKDY